MCRHFCFMDVLNLFVFYLIGCLVGAFLIWLGNQVVVNDVELAPYDWAWFSWGFVFWFMVMFISLLFHHED